MSWPWQLLIVVAVMMSTASYALWKRKHPKCELEQEQGPFRPEQRPPSYGLILPWVGTFLYRLSLLTFNNHFRKHKGRHGVFIDIYATVSALAAVSAAGLQLGASLWLIAIWRIFCMGVHVASMGLFRDYIREMRGDDPPPSSSRVVLLGFINWFELVGLYALIYQAIHGKVTWLYESFTTQATMSHPDILSSDSLSNWERFAVVSQICLSLFLLTTLIGLYVGSVTRPPACTKKEGS